MHFWTIISMLSLGFCAGLFTGAKFLTGSTTEFKVGRVKLKGEANTITSDITTEAPVKAQQKKSLFKKLRLKKNNQ